MKVEKSILVLVSLSILTAVFFMSYAPGQKVDTLDSEDTEYLADIENYKEDAVDKISANYRNMVEFNTKLKIVKNKSGIDYKSQIVILEGKNSELKSRLNKYRSNGKKEWESFRKEFDKDFNDLHKAFSDLTFEISNNHDNNLSPRFIKP